jgi:hypothetical protein
MILRKWEAWAIALLMGGVAGAQPPEAIRPTVEGRVPSPLTQDHYQPEPTPVPRLLPDSVTSDRLPPQQTPPTAQVSLGGQLAGLDLTPGFRLVSYSEVPVATLAKARLAFDVAETHFLACDLDEAHRWYREVVRLAPGTSFALVAMERLARKPANLLGPNESPEPPLAELPAAETVKRN